MVEPRDAVDLRARLVIEQRKLAAVRELGRALGANLGLDHILKTVVSKLPELIDAERATLYLLRELDVPPGAELVSRVATGYTEGGQPQQVQFQEIRLNLGVGIAGSVAESGVPLNIPDAYADRRFNPEVDRRTGFVTRSILCVPIPDHQGRTTGVLQALNRRGGRFDGDDEALMNAVAAYAGVALENSKLYESLLAQNIELRHTQRDLHQRIAELDLLYKIERESSAGLDAKELVARLTRHAVELVGGEAGLLAVRRPRPTGGPELDLTLYHPGHPGHPGHSGRGPKGEVCRAVLSTGMAPGLLSYLIERRQPVCLGTTTTTTTQASSLSTPSSRPTSGSMPAMAPPLPPHLDSATELAYLTALLGLPVHQLCAVPLLHPEATELDHDDDTALGAVVVVNRRPLGRWFTVEDLKLLTLLGGHAARALLLSRTRQSRLREGHLASIGRMLAGVLHDLRTPMTIASGYAQFMVTSESQTERERFAAMINKQFALMQAMTGEVMAFARGETKLLVRRVLMNRFVDDLREQLEREVPPGVQLLVAPNYLGPAYFDELKLLRLFHNLVRNAVQAMPGGGVLRIGVDVAEAPDSAPGRGPDGESGGVADAEAAGAGDTAEDRPAGPGAAGLSAAPPPRSSIANDNSRRRELIFTVADNGAGVPEEIQGHLFEAFVSAEKDGGTGLGLAIVKKIVDDHHGRISVSTHRGEGTTFTVAIPLSRE